MAVSDCYFLNSIHLPPVTKELIMQAMTACEKAMIYIVRPIARKLFQELENSKYDAMIYFRGLLNTV
jgi:hypothetical protein